MDNQKQELANSENASEISSDDFGDDFMEVSTDGSIKDKKKQTPPSPPLSPLLKPLSRNSSEIVPIVLASRVRNTEISEFFASFAAPNFHYGDRDSFGNKKSLAELVSFYYLLSEKLHQFFLGTNATSEAQALMKSFARSGDESFLTFGWRQYAKEMKSEIGNERLAAITFMLKSAFPRYPTCAPEVPYTEMKRCWGNCGKILSYVGDDKLRALPKDFLAALEATFRIDGFGNVVSVFAKPGTICAGSFMRLLVPWERNGGRVIHENHNIHFVHWKVAQETGHELLNCIDPLKLAIGENISDLFGDFQNGFGKSKLESFLHVVENLQFSAGFGLGYAEFDEYTKTLRNHASTLANSNNAKIVVAA